MHNCHSQKPCHSKSKCNLSFFADYTENGKGCSYRVNIIRQRALIVLMMRGNHQCVFIGNKEKNIIFKKLAKYSLFLKNQKKCNVVVLLRDKRNH